MRTAKFVSVVTLGISMLAIGLSGCSSPPANASGGGTKTVNWWTWDDKQAAAYKQCIPGFEKANPDIKVKISQYAVSDYFTKLTAGFVAGNAPDAFQNSNQYFGSYASQNQLMPLDQYISKDKLDMSQYVVGADGWKYTDGKQYGLPMDWSSTALYYNEKLIKAAGYTDKDLQNMTWNLSDGGTFMKIAAHLTIDKNGVRGDQPGFDKNNVATYGVNQLGDGDFTGQNSWINFLPTTGWRLYNKKSWSTEWNYGDKRFAEIANQFRELSDKGYAPKLGQFTISTDEQLSSSKVAMMFTGSWVASEFSQLPKVTIKIAPTVIGPDGKRLTASNSNGNVMWAGTKNPDATFKWMAYQESPTCQSVAASYNGSFFPTIKSSMTKEVSALKTKGVDLSVFENQLDNGELLETGPYANGAQMQQELQPMLESFYMHKANDEVFPKMAATAKKILAGQG